MKRITLLTLALGTLVTANSFANDFLTDVTLVDNRSGSDLAQTPPIVVDPTLPPAITPKDDKALIDKKGGELLTGFKAIFNGKDLAGWDGNPDFWSVKDGVIHGQTTPEHPAKGNTFLIWTNGDVADFELRCSFRIVPNNTKGFANSGIQYRSHMIDPSYWVVGGYQADMEAGKTYSGILYEERGRGILAERGQKVVIHADGKKDVVGSVGNSAEIQAAIKEKDWNDYRVIAKGNHLQHFINGKQTIDVVDEQESAAAKKGILALQIHKGEPMTVEFKNLKLRQTK